MAHALDFSAGASNASDAGIFARISAAVSNYRLYRKTIDELRSLSNRDLQDLGVSRYSIRQIAYESVYG